MQNNVLYGIGLMVITTFMFSSMDGFSRYLAENNNVFTLVTMRYWFIALVIIISCLFIKNPISEILKTNDINAEIEVIFQTINELNKACPKNQGDWYFSGNYPTPGGNKVVNQAYINYYEGSNSRAY